MSVFEQYQEKLKFGCPFCGGIRMYKNTNPDKTIWYKCDDCTKSWVEYPNKRFEEVS